MADAEWRELRLRQGKPTKVLVVDDEGALADLIGALLNELGYVAQAVSSGSLALRLLSEDRYHVVVTDLMMPEIDGMTILRHAKQPSVPIEVIVLTGADDVETAVSCMKAGAFDYLTKPFRLEELAGVVRSASAKVEAEEENRRLRDTIWASKQALLGALAARDGYTLSHSISVGRLAREFCCFLGLHEGVARAIEVAGELHDVGKIGVADYILNKPGRLSTDEFCAMQQHPVIGKEIIDPIGVFGGEGDLVYSHHERWDGSGYPEGLAGNEIPLVARVLSVADCFDALTSDRPYREAKPVEEAMSIITTGSGALFEPNLASGFIEFVEQGGLEAIESMGPGLDGIVAASSQGPRLAAV